MNLMLNSSVMAKSVLLLLLLFSVVSWAIILQKYFFFKNAKIEDQRFLTYFFKSGSLTNIYNYSRELQYSTVSRVFLTGYRELYVFQEMARSKQGKGDSQGDSDLISARDIKGISLALNKAINAEISRLSRRLDFLATTGSTTPFIGLFGTVWGIMTSFSAIGLQGSASIGGVAPGMAEALIATAAGLVAAIPAVIFYNYLSDKIRMFTSDLDDFSHDFIYLIEKNFSKDTSSFQVHDMDLT
ncbi:MAG: MotA/TolQ/ExbB proton channel family protein [Nitrospinaceae bacterium]|nr:MotA/TolQ/ExbB proton channel family protein [Nitrospinaceae bacterium]MDP6657051.1 MotA/TolQ/ExbB proton channel family protein [Nitrospinaceae bacterium]MDP6711599.1 MotA/TolQ/ExbB proton channel family protein [Nitrospinaceae bacterium]MDP7058640.1 MotA/TolQ/ExbB proton channel family protein [Nitrospinaceae bacterium]HAK38267.1 Tol-Pal system subunit TolQ [Nitrospina sp.]